MVFRVVGVFKNDRWHNEMSRIFLPLTTGQKLLGAGTDDIQDIFFTGGSRPFDEMDPVVERIKKYLSEKYKFDPEDQAALSVWRNGRGLKETQDLFKWIRIFIWIVGIGTIIAGIVGISNIMLIVVKERTKEIGVRKAIGARPASIIAEVLLEAVFVTGLSGFFGMAFGMLILDTVSNVMPPNDFFVNPGADVKVVTYALLLLVSCGTLAGFFPARYAAKIKPVVALRDE
jgi:putative ABC transport system permease protein